MHIEISFQKHRLRCALSCASEVGVGIFALVPKHLLSQLEVVDDVVVDFLGSGTWLLPVLAAVDHLVDIRHTAKYAYKAEIIVSAHVISLAHQARFALGCHIRIGLDSLNLLHCEIATLYALELRAIEIAQQRVVGICLKVLDVVGVSHIRQVLTALQSIVRGDVANKPLTEVCTVEFPCERSVGSVDRTDCRLSQSEVVLRG